MLEKQDLTAAEKIENRIGAESASTVGVCIVTLAEKCEFHGTQFADRQFPRRIFSLPIVFYQHCFSKARRAFASAETMLRSVPLMVLSMEPDQEGIVSVSPVTSASGSKTGISLTDGARTAFAAALQGFLTFQEFSFFAEAGCCVVVIW